MRYLEALKKLYPVNFKVAYSFAAILCRYALENKNWNAAAALKIYPSDFLWSNFPWQEAIINFTRLLGAVNIKI